MGIYFGNLDRELAERQDVLKEDAARQYHGSREVMKAFSDLGTQVASNIERLGVPEWLRGDATYDDKGKMVRGGWGGAGTQDVEVAKIDYNLHRQTESDRLRNEQHKDLRLQRRLTNIEGYNKVRAAQHSALQWNNNNPKAVQTRYEDRMKVLDKDLKNVAAVERILAYPQLFGADAVRQVATLRKLEAAGDEEAAKQARDNLPLAPLPFMKWATEQKYFNDKITGNPLAVGNRMYTAALIEADYNIPDPDEMNKSFSKEYVGNAGKELSAEEIRKQEELLNAKNVNENLSILVGRDKDLLKKKKELKTLTELTPESEAKVEDGFKNDDGTGKPLWKAEYAGVGKYKYRDLTYGVLRDSIQDVINANRKGSWDGDGKKVDTTGISTIEDDPRLFQDDKIDEDQTNLIELRQNISENLDILHPINESSITTKAKALAVKEANQFTMGLGEKIGKEVIGPRDEVKRSPSAMVYNLQGPEKERDPAFFPFYEAKKGRDMGAEYSKLPNYSTWENVDPVEKAAILTHPATELFGSSPKSVANLIKAKENVEDIDEQIGFLKDEVTKHDKNISTWEGAAQSWQAILPGDKPPHQYGGMLNEHPEKKRARTNLAMQLPLLKEERQKLLDRFNTAQADVDASATKYRKKERDWGKPSVLPSSGLPIITPSSLDSVDTEPASLMKGDLDQDVLIEGENLLETIRANEGRGVKGQGYAYFDGGDPDMKYGNYKENGGQHLTLSGGLNIYGSMKGSSADERNALADKIFIDNPEGKNEFLRYLNMEKSSHKDFYRTHKQRSKLMLSEAEQGRLTNYMLKDHLGKLQKHHPYLNKISEFPVAMQVFLVDTTFNMGPRWMKDKFKKFEGHLNKWATRGANPKEVRGMIKEFKDSDHYRKWGETDRLQDNIARLETVLGAI